jgi:hypothetical protein
MKTAAETPLGHSSFSGNQLGVSQFNQVSMQNIADLPIIDDSEIKKKLSVKLKNKKKDKKKDQESIRFGGLIDPIGMNKEELQKKFKNVNKNADDKNLKTLKKNIEAEKKARDKQKSAKKNLKGSNASYQPSEGVELTLQSPIDLD